MKKLRIILPILLVTIMVFTACTPQTVVETVEVVKEVEVVQTVEVVKEAEKTVSGQIVLYTSESEAQVNEMVADFNEVYPDIEIFIYRTGTGEVTAKLQAEMEGGDIKADLIWFADLNFFSMLADEDMLLDYMPVGGDLVDESNHYFDNRAHEVRYIFNIVAYNTGLVDPPPTGWKDLLNPDYKGRIGMASALYSGGAFNNLGTLVNEPDFGWEFYEELNANDVVVGRGNGGIGTKIASGEFAMGQLIDYMARDLKNEGSPIEMIWPEEGSVLVPTPIGIYKNTTNPDACKAFLDYLYSDRAQELFISQSYMSINPNAPKPEGFTDYPEGGLKILTPPVDFMEENREELRTKYEELFGPPPEA